MSNILSLTIFLTRSDLTPSEKGAGAKKRRVASQKVPKGQECVTQGPGPWPWWSRTTDTGNSIYPPLSYSSTK